MVHTKSILMLGRRDPTEAMRVAAGLTIFSHTLSIVFMAPVADTPENNEMAELLEFSDIESKTTLPDQALPCIDADDLAAAILAADMVINL